MQPGTAPGGFDDLEAFGLGAIVKPDFWFLTRQLHRRQDPPIQVGPEMVVERLLCLPLFGVADVVVQEVIFGPTTDASGAGPAKVLNRTQEFEHFRPVFRNGEKPYG